MRGLGAGLLVFLLAGTEVSAAGLRGYADGWLLSPDELESLLRPAAGDSLAGAGWLELGQTRLFGMPELPVLAIRGGFELGPRARRWRARFGWERTGEGLYVEDQREMVLGFGGRFSAGVALWQAAISIDGQTESEHRGAALVLDYQPPRRAGWRGRLGVRLDLDGPPLWFGRRGRRELARGSLTHAPGRWALAVSVDRDGDGAPGFSVHLFLALAGRLGIGLRADPPTGSLGPTTYWRVRGLAIRTAHVAHPQLGPTHRVGIVLGSAGAAGR